ncbi:unnamed protein product [Cladocopium goreaui]|uniref:Uncharacterized protein n=1 Tax=Cladocopium goreaui TaxID=2562237 RepID=A0A9P1C326_9DINO|nr:unnamed protein product [Cladocopium goreaui]
MHDAMSEYLACRDEAQSLSLLHTKSTYQGLGSPEASYQTVLNAALKDPRDHHAVASDFAFRTREVLPVPFEVSLKTIARKEGWEPETFMARGFDCSLMRSTDVAPHARMPPSRVFVLLSKNMPELASFRMRLPQQYAVTSGRETRHSGLHYGNKEKMCTWLNCEDDKTVTGDGATALSHYTQVYGLVSLCEYVLQPTASMFSKRIHATWQTRPVTSDPDQQSQSSKEFLIDFFGWMGRVASNQDKDHYFDKFALPVLRKALQGISDFFHENHENVEEPI